MRIRTIKPEFWVSESVGRLSRDARLLFIGLWSFADDSGRGRGALPAISGTIFPYDLDAPKHVETWFNELEREGMVRRYKAEDGNSYYDIPKWLSHQRIEKPSKSKIPQFQEYSPTIPRTLPDISPLEQGTGNRDQGTGNMDSHVQDSTSIASPSGAATQKSNRFVKPTIEEVAEMCGQIGLDPAEAEIFWHHHNAAGWVIGRAPMKSWASALHKWKSKKKSWASQKQPELPQVPDEKKDFSGPKW